MKIAVVGGNLQGTEATYLAHKAGWEVLLIDKNPAPPASGLCDVFVQMDVTDSVSLNKQIRGNGIQLVIPATENQSALDSLVEWSGQSSVPLAFDADAYAISSSKLKSDRLFARLGVPAPLHWPKCGFPLIAKPSGGSGSKGVLFIHNREELENRFPGSQKKDPENWVLQEYVEGPPYSLEIVGTPGNYRALQVTGLEMDAGYDCKRVKAPSEMSPGHINQFEQLSLEIAEAIALKGLMDVEAILHNGELKVLEIDARLPSQTPTAVYWSTGVNMLELLTGCFIPLSPEVKTQKTREIIYEHIMVSPGGIEVCGEHIMAGAGPLTLRGDFHGADEALTNYEPGKEEWVATLIRSREYDATDP